MNSQADFKRYEREVKLSDDKHPLSERDKAILNALKNKPNRNYRITPDLMNRDELAIDRYARENPGGFATMKAACGSRPTATRLEDSMKEVGRKVLKTMTEHYLADGPGRWEFPNEYNGKVYWYHPHCTGKPADLSEESLRALIKQCDVITTVDPAAKNKNKERKMDNELREGVPVGVGRGSSRARPVDVYSVGIDKVENGFIINIGCKTFVSTSWKEAAKALGEYFEDPIAAEKKYCKKGD